MGYVFNIDVDDDFRLIHESNMSKLCRTKDSALQTVQKYEKDYKNGNSPYDSPAYKLSDNGEYYVVYNKSTNKVLKSINYLPVKLL